MPKDLKELLVYKAQLVHKELLVQLVWGYRELLARQVHKEFKGLPEMELVYLVLLVLQVHKAQLVQRVHKEFKA